MIVVKLIFLFSLIQAWSVDFGEWKSVEFSECGFVVDVFDEEQNGMSVKAELMPDATRYSHSNLRFNVDCVKFNKNLSDYYSEVKLTELMLQGLEEGFRMELSYVDEEAMSSPSGKRFKGYVGGLENPLIVISGKLFYIDDKIIKLVTNNRSEEGKEAEIEKFFNSIRFLDN